MRRLRTHFRPEDILRARAIEDRLYEQTWLAEDYDLIPRLRPLTTPTLVMHSEYDFVPLRCARNIADAIPGSRLVVLEGCGHFAHIESPADVHRTIAGFMSRA